tara:strand:- start:204 stop:467 length:264 start_codon:yes stop_codon:yes gene_type:complete
MNPSLKLKNMKIQFTDRWGNKVGQSMEVTYVPNLADAKLWMASSEKFLFVKDDCLSGAEICNVEKHIDAIEDEFERLIELSKQPATA